MKALYGEVVDLKLVRTRQQLQVVIELPIEAYRAAVNAVGLNAKVLVTLASLPSGIGFGVVDGDVTPDEPEICMQAEPKIEVKKPHPGGFGSLSARTSLAVRWCKDPVFQEWVSTQEDGKLCPITEDGAKTWMLAYLGIMSRGDIDANPEAKDKFDALRQKYVAYTGSR